MSRSRGLGIVLFSWVITATNTYICIYSKGTHFFEHERFVTIHWVNAIVRHYAGAEFFSDRVCWQPVHFDVYVGADAFVGEHLTGYDIDGERARDYAIHGGLGERVECAVGSSHELRLQQITAAHVELEYSQVELHGHVHSLIVQRDQLAARVPEHLRHKVGRVETGAGWIHAAQLIFVVLHELHRPLFQQRHRLFLVKRRHLVVTIFLCPMEIKRFIR